MLMLALAAIGMVLGTAGLENQHEKHDRRKTGDGGASRGPVAVEDRHGYPERERPARTLVLH
jgi:hypothetical protein